MNTSLFEAILGNIQNDRSASTLMAFKEGIKPQVTALSET